MTGLFSSRATKRRSVVPSHLFGTDCEVETFTDYLRNAFIIDGIPAVEQGKVDKIAVVFERFDAVAGLFGIVYFEHFGQMTLQICGLANVFQPPAGRMTENKRTGATFYFGMIRQVRDRTKRQRFGTYRN